MNELINKYSEEIWNIYNDNFPLYLKEPRKKFITKLPKYKFWDILFFNKIHNKKQSLNNISKQSGLNKETTYSNLNFSVFINNVSDLETLDVAGFSLFNFFPKKKILHLDYLSLSKTMQGKGNGKAYLQYLINQIYKKHSKLFSYFVLECEDHLINFYKSNGFVSIDFNYYYKGIKMNLMIYTDKKISKYTMRNIGLFLSNVFSKNGKNANTKHFVLTISLILKYSYEYLFIINYKFRFHIIDNFQKIIFQYFN